MKYQVHSETNLPGSKAQGRQIDRGAEPKLLEAPNLSNSGGSDAPGIEESHAGEVQRIPVQSPKPSPWSVPVRPAYRWWGLNE